MQFSYSCDCSHRSSRCLSDTSDIPWYLHTAHVPRSRLDRSLTRHHPLAVHRLVLVSPLPCLQHGALHWLVPRAQALKTKVSATLIALDQLRALRRVAFHLHDARTAVSGAVVRQAIALNECVDEKTLVPSTKTIVEREQSQYLLIVDDLNAPRQTVDRTSTTGLEDIGLQIASPALNAMRVSTW